MKKIIGGVIFLCCLLFYNNTCYAKKIEIKRTKEGGYTLYINGAPFFAKGVIYNPTPIGEGYDYNFFSDENKPWLTDGKLMQELGINCVRIYSAGKDLEKTKEFIRDMYEKFGIYTVMSDWMGLWSYPAANYSDKDFQEKIKKDILEVVDTLKDEEGLLLWILGNENNYTFSGKIGFWTSPEIEKIDDPYLKINKKAEIYYSFANDIARQIKKTDKTHPVALGNGEASSLDIAAKTCRNIDLLAIIIYRGKNFGNLFTNIKRVFDKPVFLSEFGCDSYDAYREKEDQDIQSEFLLSQWEDLYRNTTAGGNPGGNCIGGASFEWSDEWWKHEEGYSPGWIVHNTEGGWSQGSYYFDNRVKNNLNMNEEWFGLVALSEEIKDGVNKRIPKKSFHALKNFFIRRREDIPGQEEKITPTP